VLRTCIVLAILIASSTYAQAPATPMRFEVATIKPTDPAFRGILVGAQGGIFSARGFTLKDLIAYAYGIDNRQILNVPKLLESERYDVTGKPEKEGRPNPTEAKLMLQALLSDRFQLQFHRETKKVPVYILTVAKGGSKMKPRTEGDGGAPRSMLFQGPKLPGRNLSVADLAGGLQKMVLDRPVMDKTGLTGNFDFDLVWRPDLVQVGGRGGAIPADVDVPDLFTAIQEQLGLKLEPQNEEMEVIVVDKSEKPSDN
jgi:uncharacterized protein (TIGR03435 family)